MGQPDPELRYHLPDASLADAFLDFDAVTNRFLLTVTQADCITECVTFVTTQFDLRKQNQCDIEIFEVPAKHNAGQQAIPLLRSMTLKRHRCPHSSRVR